MNTEHYNLVFDRTSMLSAIQSFEVESAKKVNHVCQYLEAFQMSTQAWSICSGMLWELEDHRINVLFMCGTMLRQKIRTQLNLLTDEAQDHLRDTLLGQIKNAAHSDREGIESIMRLIALIIADMGLRIRDRQLIVSNVIAELWFYAPQALLEIVKVLPEQPEGKEVEQQQQLLRNQCDTVLQLLTNLLNRMDLDLISIWRGCFLCYGAWAYKGLFPVETMLENTVVLHAIALLQQPELMQRQLYADACKCFVGVINCLGNHPIGSDPAVMKKMRKNIFAIVHGITGSFNRLERKEKDYCAEILNKLTKVYAGINDKDITNDSLIHFGPICFQLQLHVVKKCSMIALLESLHLWHQLAWQLRHRYELELYYLYQPLVKTLVLDLYPRCRLTHPSDVKKELISSLRNQFRELVPKFADLLGLNAIMPDMLNQICDTLSSESDLEMALFFVGPLVKFLDVQLPYMVDQLMNCLPRLYGRTLFCSLPAHEQLIFCLSKCHMVKNNLKRRQEFVIHLSNVCASSADKVLIIAALEAFKALANIYTDVANLKHMFKTQRLDDMLVW